MAGTKNNHNEQGSDQNQNTKLPFEDADETMCDADVADDITSADYYFDSYSHFGNKKTFIFEASLIVFFISEKC